MYIDKLRTMLNALHSFHQMGGNMCHSRISEKGFKRVLGDNNCPRQHQREQLTIRSESM